MSELRIRSRIINTTKSHFFVLNFLQICYIDYKLHYFFVSFFYANFFVIILNCWILLYSKQLNILFLGDRLIIASDLTS